MIVYLDSSALARAYLADEPGHEQAASLLADPEIGSSPVPGPASRCPAHCALLGPGEDTGFATRAEARSRVATSLGLRLV